MPSKAFEEFVQETTPVLLGRARALAADPHDAWDLVQETLVRIGERWESLDNPAAYASTVMTRLNIDRIRRLRRELGLRQRLARPVPVALPEDGPEAWLVDALQTLSPHQRTALALRYLDDSTSRPSPDSCAASPAPRAATSHADSLGFAPPPCPDTPRRPDDPGRRGGPLRRVRRAGPAVSSVGGASGGGSAADATPDPAPKGSGCRRSGVPGRRRGCRRPGQHRPAAQRQQCRCGRRSPRIPEWRPARLRRSVLRGRVQPPDARRARVGGRRHGHQDRPRPRLGHRRARRAPVVPRWPAPP